MLSTYLVSVKAFNGLIVIPCVSNGFMARVAAYLTVQVGLIW